MLKLAPNPPLSSRPPTLRAAEEGYMLIGVLVLVAMLLIALAVAAPRVAVELQRDKEDELVHRGLQYAHAIRLYYKKFGRYPASLEQLEKTNEIRFLRKRYKDPITGKDEWHLIHFGEAKVKPTGLFGKPLEVGGAAGAGPGNAGTTGSSAFGGASQTGLGGSTFGPASGIAGGGAFSSGASTTSSATDSQAGSTADTSGSGGTGSGISGTSAPGTPAGSSSTAIGGSGQTFGGGGIVGVSSTSPKASIREFKKQKHYNEWEFVYDPMQDRMAQNGTGIAQQPGATNLSNPNSSSSPGFGPSTMGGGTTPPPTAPQQQ